VLDTGNGAPVSMFLSPTAITTLGLGTERDGAVRVESFRLGDQDHRMDVRTAAVLDALEQISAAVGVPVAGNVGYSFLKTWQVGIDYRAGVVRLMSGAGFRDAGTPFDTGPGGAFVLLPARINGRGPFRVLLDSGASSSVVSPTLAKDLGIRGQPVEAIGVGGSSVASLGVLESLEVAGHVMTNVSAAVVDVFGYTSQAAGVPIDAILGYSFLKEFHVVIDYPRRRLFLERYDSTTDDGV
jgi:hypothetical protein